LLVRAGRIVEVGEDIGIPPDAEVLDFDNTVVAAGFWNTHVHFTERKWAGAGRKPPSAINRQLADMLTSRGFTTVVDAGSDPRITLSVRKRIEAGELLGPAIYTAGVGLYPPRGIPYYLRDSLPWYAPWFMPQPSSPSAARKAVQRNIARGADLVKLFTGSYVKRGTVLPMPEPIAKAAVDVAHAHHQLVYAHPSDLAGTLVALQSGVDVLAHAPDITDGIDDRLLQNLVDHRVGMVPTLKMFGTTVRPDEGYLKPIYEIVRRFRDLGGEMMFGTDVGYMADYDTEGEFRALGESGLGWKENLRMLTSAPAQRFGATDKGVIAPGKTADLVLLDEDPASDPRAFARVRATVRGGRVLWSRS
jgi:imidazolonepropionase-like amidohydrolase